MKGKSFYRDSMKATVGMCRDLVLRHEKIMGGKKNKINKIESEWGAVVKLLYAQTSTFNIHICA